MTHEWMRQDAVDILQYLPAFLSRSPDFKSTNDADSKEHDTIRIAIQDVLDQCYVASATWGLERWEELVGITTDTTLDINIRRQNVLSKLQNPESVTKVFLTNLVNRYIADKAGFIMSYPPEYRIEILYHGGQVLDYEKLRNAVQTYIPAHIGFKLITYTTGTLIHYGAGTMQTYTKTAVDMTTGYAISVKDMTQYAAGAVVHNYKKVRIGG